MTMTVDRPMPQPVSLELPFTAESAGVARGRLDDWLVGAGARDERRGDAQLLLSELVGNAVRHARPLDDETLRVEWARPERSILSIAVTDGGGAGSVPAVVDAADGDVSGRGLMIVEFLSHRWWVENSSERVTVRAELPLD